MRNWLLLACLVVLIGAVGTIAWTVLEWPPPLLILKYGLPPQGGATGRTWTDPSGLEFVEIAAGYCHVELRYRGAEGDLLGRLCKPLGLPFGEHPEVVARIYRSRWIEVPRPFWLSAGPYSSTGSYAYHWRGIEPGAHHNSACPVCKDAVLEYASVDQLQFADVLGAPHFGEGGIRLARWGPVASVEVIEGVIVGPRWCGRPATRKDVDDDHASDGDEYFRFRAHLVWIPPADFE